MCYESVDMWRYVLHWCIKNKALSHGMIIHARITKLGFTENLVLQNTLANMYVKCGSVVNARNVFDKMRKRDVFSWTVMIAAYARHGFAGEALALFNQMAGMAVLPNQFTFATVVSACAGFASIQPAVEIHEKVITSGFADDVIVGNALIHMYAKCGSIHKSRRLFSKIPKPDIVSWNSILAGYAQAGLMCEALELFEDMPQQDVVSWNTMIAGYGQIGLVDEALQLFKKMPRQDIVSWTALIAGYARSGLVLDSLKLFKEMPQRNLVSWNALIAGFVRSGHDDESVKLFQQMQSAGMTPDSTSFACILRACANLAAMHPGLEIHGKIIRTGSQFDLTVVNAVVGMYTKCGSVERAHKVFDRMHCRDDVSWTSMISGYAQNGLVDEALRLFKQMPQPNLVSWNALIVGVAQNGHWKKALEVFQEMQLADVRPDVKTLASILQVCASLTTVEHGMEIHGMAISTEFQSDVFVMTALINMYAQCGSIVNAHKVFQQMRERDQFTWNTMISGYLQNEIVDEALKLFKEMPQPNVVSWNTMIGGFSKNGIDEEALKLFQQMQLFGVPPDPKTFATVLSTCANLAALEKGMEVHAKAIRNAFMLNILVVNSMIHMYAKCGSIDKAQELFEKMNDRDVVSWNTIIAGYAMHGSGKEAIKLFEQMKSSDMKPDHVTLVSVLSACNHGGLVVDAHKYFNSISDYNITPTTQHYICMVDLLCRIGHLNEAQDFINNNMPIKSVSLVWRCFLGACRLHNNIELGECAAQRLFELDLKDDAAPYVLLSNIYAAAGRWGDMGKMYQHDER